MLHATAPDLAPQRARGVVVRSGDHGSGTLLLLRSERAVVLLGTPQQRTEQGGPSRRSPSHRRRSHAIRTWCRTSGRTARPPSSCGAGGERRRPPRRARAPGHGRAICTPRGSCPPVRGPSPSRRCRLRRMPPYCPPQQALRRPCRRAGQPSSARGPDPLGAARRCGPARARRAAPGLPQRHPGPGPGVQDAAQSIFRSSSCRSSRFGAWPGRDPACSVGRAGSSAGAPGGSAPTARCPGRGAGPGTGTGFRALPDG